MPSGKATTVDKWLEYLALRRQGHSLFGSAKDSGLSYHACRDAESGKAPRNYTVALEKMGGEASPEIPEYDELCPEAQEAYDNIEIFAKRYFGIILQPWQIEATERIMALMDTEFEEYVVINAPPGSGKSTFFAKVLPAWATVRNRALRGMIGSSTQRLAEWYARRLRAELDRAHPVRAELNGSDADGRLRHVQTRLFGDLACRGIHRFTSKRSTTLPERTHMVCVRYGLRA